MATEVYINMNNEVRIWDRKVEEKWKKRGSDWAQGEPFSPQGDISAVEEASQRRCAGSILGGSQDPTGSSPKQPSLTSDLVLLSAGVGLEMSW